MAYVGGELAPWFRRGSSERAMRNMVRLGVAYAAEVTEDNTPVETGDLRASWKTSRPRPMPASTGVGLGATWYTEVDYAPYVEHGTGLYGPEHSYYLIEPRKPGGVLHWVGRGGADVFARKVWHPGSPGNHMVAIAAAMLEHRLGTVLRPALGQWARETALQGDGVS